jgi:hypothetical protein
MYTLDLIIRKAFPVPAGSIGEAVFQHIAGMAQNDASSASFCLHLGRYNVRPAIP